MGSHSRGIQVRSFQKKCETSYIMQNAHLREDAGYLQYQTAKSTFPFAYVTAFAPPGCPSSNCNKQFNPGARNVGALNEVRGSRSTRIMDRSKTSTELFGTAPLKAQGDGNRKYIDTSNSLRDGDTSTGRCARPLTEAFWGVHTLDYQFVPNNVESWGPRAGKGTRAGPIFTLPGQIPTTSSS